MLAQAKQVGPVPVSSDLSSVDVQSIQLDALSKMKKQNDAALRSCPDCAKHRRKNDIVNIRIAELMRGLDEFESPTCVIVKKEGRRHMSPSQRRALRRAQSYLFEVYHGN